MKIWYGYGSDHSANLVMVGEFKTEADANKVSEIISTLCECAQSDFSAGIIDHWAKNEQYSEDTEKQLRELGIYSLSPSDIADFALLDTSMKKVGTKLEFRTDDVDVGAFVKLMVDHGARVQVYSAHQYPDAEES